MPTNDHWGRFQLSPINRHQSSSLAEEKLHFNRQGALEIFFNKKVCSGLWNITLEKQEPKLPGKGHIAPSSEGQGGVVWCGDRAGLKVGRVLLPE